MSDQVRLYLVATKPTDAVTEGFLPAAARLGLTVTVLTDRPDEHRRAYAGHPARPAEIVGAAVRDFRELVAEIASRGRPDAIFSNSDHLQTQTALAAAFFGLPGKSWSAALRVKNKAQMRRALAAAGLDTVFCAELRADEPPDALARRPIPYPCVLKPREGVASEDVLLVADAAELVARAEQVRTRRPGEALLVEEYLPGPLRTLETVGDGLRVHVVGAFRTTLSPPPHFIERRMDYDPDPPASLVASALAQLSALGVGFGACHTEFVAQGERARLVEVNYRVIGDRCDLLLAEMLGIPLFEDVLRAHLGETLPPRPALAWLDGAGRGPHARMDWVLAPRAGRLAAAPGPLARSGDGLRLRYQPLRAVGDRLRLTHTNRDFIGVVSAHGPDPGRVARAVERFLADNAWVVTPEDADESAEKDSAPG